jgi:hypothetical protein
MPISSQRKWALSQCHRRLSLLWLPVHPRDGSHSERLKAEQNWHRGDDQF